MSTFTSVLLVAAALPALLSSTAAGEVASPFADIPNVTIVTYDVAGRNVAAVRRAINAVRPTDPHDGQRVDGLSHYQFRWRWHDDGRGKCTATPEDITFSATVTVPRLAESDPPARLRDMFDRYLQSLLAHEDGHIRYAWNHRGDIAAAINAATCDTARTASQAALKTIGEHDIEYDKATRHGSATGIPFG